MAYQDDIQNITDISFDEIIELNKRLVPASYRNRPWAYPGLNHGTAVLETTEQLSAYIAAYGWMHKLKIQEVFQNINRFAELRNYDVQIVDWGCGQGVATVCFSDFFKENGFNLDFIKHVVLIEPSVAALERAKIHTAKSYGCDTITAVNKYLDDVDENDIMSDCTATIHLFSNILDIPQIDLRLLANKIKSVISGTHYFFCFGPLNRGNDRIDVFWNYFNESESVYENSHSKQVYDASGQLVKTFPYTAKNRVFKIRGGVCELIAVDYYQPKQFHAAFQLDSVRTILKKQGDKEKLNGLYRNLSDFEIQTPFDIGASIYEDVNPVFAVLNNIITRGLPTKASPRIEEAFAKFGNQKVTSGLGAVNYCIDGLNYDDIFSALHIIDSRWKLSADNYNCDLLESELEKEFITQSAPAIFKQLLQPQRWLSSITDKISQRSQRIDFTLEFPYGTNDRRGCAIETDGSAYHNNDGQLLSDRQRCQELESVKWHCIRLGENEIGKPLDDYHYLGSEYVKNILESYNKQFDNQWIKTLQLVLTPIAVARIEKSVLEALMTGVLDIKANRWKILAKEYDVPCVALAFEDLKEHFNHLTQLSADYSTFRFPEIDLTIVSTKEFADSPLHLGNRVIVNEYHTNTEFDMVIDFAILRRAGLEKINFTEYKCKNKCYFNIRSAHYHRNERQIYTTNRITYNPLVTSDSQGRYKDIPENVRHLRYFLQLLFRKEDFRPGQTPILSRALQNKSVIGLLPTGGGKSLTYQIAAMLQPGITLVIDPLRSLMKDQFDGLISAGIDSCTYINSSIEVPDTITGKHEIERYRIEERERRAKRMENSELQFMFLSPERLGIKNFRTRLENMQETGVYFAYGVIDEVHCVSEWGHDFRFSYLHLGRNLYRYVLPKQDDGNGRITLFGLTATASFDVLADVERELSGNGAFPLDSDTIVRNGGTDRFELQYKIESVPVEFGNDDRLSFNVRKWDIYDAKKDALQNVIDKMPSYLNELLSDTSIEVMTKSYKEGPRYVEGANVPFLQVDIPNQVLSNANEYDYGGIIFCPHTKSTGVSVKENARNIGDQYLNVPIGTFVGGNDDDNSNTNAEQNSFKNLELFRDNKIPLMIATKAFGMGIDKPNVRFTINMNYSSSLESFVQEAGRAGRDRKMALSVIMMSQYKIARIKPESKYFRNYYTWYNANDLQALSEILQIPIEEFDVCDETSDLVKLKCKECGDSCKRFENNHCHDLCPRYNERNRRGEYVCNDRSEDCLQPCKYFADCKLAKIPNEKRWSNYEHLEKLKSDYPFITNVNYEYLNADYETLLFFYNNNFKGELAEKRVMYNLLSNEQMDVTIGENDNNSECHSIKGFLTTLQSVNVGDKLVSFISYKNRYEDFAKAIYRMCCIELIDDFTQDYNNETFRVVSVKKADGEYYKALENYLKRYYSAERAAELIKEVPEYKGENEIHKCLGYLTHFIYDKIAVKRKRAIDDMHAFCLRGINKNRDWKEINEELKDDLYFYFNSKYARKGYTTNNGEQYSLTDETEEGKKSTSDILFKFMKVVDNKWIEDNSEAGSTQIDNAKHLYGAVRLIRRQITDDNAAIYLLSAFCLMFLGTNNNKVLETELGEMYIDGMKTFYLNLKGQNNDFWKGVFDEFNNNQYVNAYFHNNGTMLKSAAVLEIHKLELETIKNKYTA